MSRYLTRPNNFRMESLGVTMGRWGPWGFLMGGQFSTATGWGSGGIPRPLPNPYIGADLIILNSLRPPSNVRRGNSRPMYLNSSSYWIYIPR